ncbi:MAG TPA: ABC transporter substrate-binding protein [Solirubrobacterales bacterium]
MLFALGLGDQVVAVTHECDYPPEAAGKRQLTRSLVPTYSAATKTAAGSTAGQIDAEVRRLTGEGRHLYELDEPTLRELDVDLIVTQAVCEVCAVSYDDVVAVAARLPSKPQLISLDPSNLGEVLADITRLGDVAGVADRAIGLRNLLGRRLERVRAAVEGISRPRVLALEWLEPPFVGGHWVPEMIEIAGGVDVLGVAGTKSRTAGWEELVAAAPDVIVGMPCGWDAPRAREEVESRAAQVAAIGAERIWAVDAAASFSRPGPRLVEGTELLAHLLHPDRVEAPAGVSFEPVPIVAPAGRS